MKTETLPTVDELNEIQREWMALDCDALEPEKKRVFAMMKRYPRCYISTNAKQALATVICDGGPLNRPMPIHQAIELCTNHHGRTDVFWQCPLWVKAPDSVQTKRARNARPILLSSGAL